MLRRVLTLEGAVTALLALMLAGLVVWRLDLLGLEPPPRGMPEDPFLIVAVRPAAQGHVTQSAVFPRAQIAARAEAGRLFETLEGLPRAGLAPGRYRVFRMGDEAEVTAAAQAAATAGGNRCLIAIDRGVIAAQGGALTAVVSLRAELDLKAACGG
ncbi:hypothetical protein LNKW23_45240 [Paralimibaculum aggregatum]|uniref:GerMN domain-containing protein n=1 Tax=Paralimibaculum aggregatum TaxID=3036245 RepID=A0ABQ6LT93_9RHOB|nr:hypothetical protein [Limibaculum sp. NKW23]GMG85305.1 hypothetical protein LNKW23_45240 [Limibaculum sp. NKW23]